MYTLNIQKMEENKQTYYLWKIDWLKGFLVEWTTIEKVKELAPYILKDYLETIEEMKKVIQYKNMIQFSFQTA